MGGVWITDTEHLRVSLDRFMMRDGDGNLLGISLTAMYSTWRDGLGKPLSS